MVFSYCRVHSSPEKTIYFLQKVHILSVITVYSKRTQFTLYMSGAVKTNAPRKRRSFMNATVKFKNASAQPPRIKIEIVLKMSSQNFGAWKLLNPSWKSFIIICLMFGYMNFLGRTLSWNEIVERLECARREILGENSGWFKNQFSNGSLISSRWKILLFVNKFSLGGRNR